MTVFIWISRVGLVWKRITVSYSRWKLGKTSKRDCKNLILTKQESSKIFYFLFIPSMTTVAREGSIKIETRVLTPKSLRSRISSKSKFWFATVKLIGEGVTPKVKHSKSLHIIFLFLFNTNLSCLWDH